MSAAAQGHAGRELIDPAIVQRASEWMARLWSGEASEADRSACAAWRAAHPEHERAWNRLQAMEEQLIRLPREAARRVLLDAPPALATRRGALRLLGTALVLGGVGYSLRRSDAWKLASSDFTAATGEIRTVTLPDGTRVVLDTDSAIDLRYSAQERRVILRTGQILVTTAASPAPAYRPFLIECAQGMVRALGTRFTVRQEDDAAQVAVYQGAVEIRPARAPDAALRLDAGQRTVFSDAQALPPLPAQESAAAWAQGNLVAEQMRVADFVAELGRYRHGVLRCDAGAAALRVSGVFPLRDTGRALENLTLGVPVEVLYRSRYWVTVRAR